LEDFSGWMNKYQSEWRRDHVACSEWGWFKGKQYEWILPPHLWEQGLWPGIRSEGQYPLTEYILENRIHKHDDCNNLKSGWVHCANLYFPFGQTDFGRHLLAGFLRANVCADVMSVDKVELEYAEAGDLHPSVLLGEIGGSRGIGQTSPDLGLLVNAAQGLILVESKFTERNFEPCSAKIGKGRSLPPNPDQSRCKNPLAGLDAERECHQVTWHRRYWEHLAPVVNVDVMSKLKCCPAARAGYQLLRQQALAEGIANSGKYDLVVSCVAMDFRNEALLTCLNSTGIADVRDWGKLFNGKAKFAVWDHQQWVTWVEKKDTAGEWRDWLQYVKCRYGYV